MLSQETRSWSDIHYDNNDSILRMTRDYPRPIASTFAKAERVRDPETVLQQRIRSAEVTVRYLALTALARYLKTRESCIVIGVDEALQKLQRPTFGDWLSVLDTLDSHLHDDALYPFGDVIRSQRSSPEMAAFANHGTNKTSGRVSILSFFQRVVALRNETTGHGDVNAKLAREVEPLLCAGLMAALQGLSVLVTRPPIYVDHIEYEGRNEFLVEYFRIVGTARSIRYRSQLAHPGSLEPGRVYAWSGGQDEPLELSPVVHYDPDSTAFYVMSRTAGGKPVFDDFEQSSEHRPDGLMEQFRERAPFLLEQTSAESLRPPFNRMSLVEAILRGVRNDPEASVAEPALVRVIRDQLRLSDAEMDEVSRRVGRAVVPATRS